MCPNSPEKKIEKCDSRHNRSAWMIPSAIKAPRELMNFDVWLTSFSNVISRSVEDEFVRNAARMMNGSQKSRKFAMWCPPLK